ncbi:NHL repeat-containing protein [Capillimicrobium parvum]|uniref:Virginiamycin B lyase n=1 Tax=Capillimicrobium parvum TaxID=2884022 RepID=A0A9E7C2Z5_9ACTN|nr:NHL repeat-containing protein [Capillimicrobium parvum]UGS39015.1 Virginiamycin B lyase [Capillimicrobium parvum]
MHHGWIALAGTAALLAAAAPAQAATLTGTVKAGGKPVAGSDVQLFAARAADQVALGSASTNASGAYTLGYDLPEGTAALVARASGGSVGGRVLPAAARMMTATAVSPAVPGELPINEQTTVGAAYALTRFLDAAGAVRGPSPGLANAAATVASLVEPSTGKLSFTIANSPNGNATEALATFNTLAGIVTSCTTGTSRDCKRLLAAATPRGGPRPADTIAAMRALNRAPTTHPRRLFALTTRTPYTGTLSSAPKSWVIPIVFVGGGMNAPGRMAFDSKGNIWTGNNFQANTTSAGLTLSVFNPMGQPILGSPIVGGGLRGAGFGTVIDAQDRVWVGNYAGASISAFDATGAPLPGSPYTQGPIDKPQGMAVDQQGNLWTASFGTGSVVVYPKGDPTAAWAPITGAGLARPFSVAIDGGGVAWVTGNAFSKDPGTVQRINPDGSLAGAPITGGGLRSPLGIAIDTAGNAWAANFEGSSVTRITPDGQPTQIRVPSLLGPWGVAVDGDDNIWVAGFLHQNVTLLCGQRTEHCPPGTRTGQPISPRAAGYRSRGMQRITAVQIDPSGNVWLANNWSGASPLKDFIGGNGLVELIGAAAPVKAPQIGLPQRP